MNNDLMQKDYDCPICRNRFKASRPRMAKLKLVGVDNDFRPYYEGLDVINYEVVVCNSCGFTALNNTFSDFNTLNIERTRMGLRTINVSKSYTIEVTSTEAAERYLAAIQLLEHRQTTDSQYYYLYLRLAWIYRVLDDEDALENEFLALRKALFYLEAAYKTEEIPFFDMDKSNIVFLIGELARRVGDYEKANLYIGKAVFDPLSTEELRDRAKETKLLIANDYDQYTAILDKNSKARVSEASKNNKKSKSKKTKMLKNKDKGFKLPNMKKNKK